MFAGRTPSGRKRRIVLRFLVSPVEIVGSNRVEGVKISRNRLVRAPQGELRAEAGLRRWEEQRTASSGASAVFAVLGGSFWLWHVKSPALPRTDQS